MQIYIIRHATKIDEEIAGTAFFSMENAEKELNRLAQRELETFPDRLGARLETIPGQGADIIINSVRAETFRIVPLESEKPSGKWDFRNNEEVFDTAGANFAGVLTDGENILYWHAYKDNENDSIEKCHIYNSIFMDPDSEECVYYWTAENDSALLETLNSLENPSDYCGEGSPLHTLTFPNKE